MPFKWEQYVEAIKTIVGFQGMKQKGVQTKPVISKPAAAFRFHSGILPAPQDVLLDMQDAIGASLYGAVKGPRLYEYLIQAYGEYGGMAAVYAMASRMTHTTGGEGSTEIVTSSVVPLAIAYRKIFLDALVDYKESTIAKVNQPLIDFIKSAYGGLLKSNKALAALARAVQEAQQRLFAENFTARINCLTIGERSLIGLADDPDAQAVAAEYNKLLESLPEGYSDYKRFPAQAQRLTPRLTMGYAFVIPWGTIVGTAYEVDHSISFSGGGNIGSIHFWLPEWDYFGGVTSSRAIEGFGEWASGDPRTLRKIYPSGVESYSVTQGQTGSLVAVYRYGINVSGGVPTGGTGGGTGGVTNGGTGGGTGGVTNGGTGGGTSGVTNGGTGGGTGGVTGGGGTTVSGSTYIASDWAWCVTRFPNDPVRQQQCLQDLQKKLDVTQPALIGAGTGLGTFVMLGLLALGGYFIYKKVK